MITSLPTLLVSQRPTQLVTGVGSAPQIPRTNLLIYLARPNSDEYLVGEDTEIGEDTYIWGYVLPEALFTELGEGLFFTSEGTPIVVLASEILADPNTNRDHVIFKSSSVVQQTGRLAIYAPNTPLSTLRRAYSVMGIPFVIENVDNSGNQWVDGAGNILTSSRF